MRVKDLPVDERPRERLLSHGPAALADRELLAVLIDSGYQGASAVDLAAQVITHCGDLTSLGSADPHRLLAIPGIGPAKAARVAAAFNLVRRAAAEPGRQRVSSTSELAAVAAPLLRGQARERLVLVVCDARGAVLRRTALTEGSAELTVLPVREVIATALTSGGVGFGVAHNHPSGSLDPSSADLAATLQLVEAAETVGLRFLDHVIVTESGWRRIAWETIES